MEFKAEIPSPAIGIDLGTTYSRVAVFRNGSVEIIPNDEGSRATPSSVAFTLTGNLFGESANYQAAVNPSNTIFDVKRFIGRKRNDREALLNNLYLRPYKFLRREDKPNIVVTYKGEIKSFVPEEISAMVLCRMTEIAEAYLGTTVKDVVVTVPACFNNIQRQATKDAGKIAGLNVKRIINEPTAAAIAYDLQRIANDRKNVLVFDLGGGTFDVSLVIIENSRFEVKSVSGNTCIGGQDFDNRMIEHFLIEFKRKHGKDIRNNSRALEKLRTACERAKRILSTAMSTSIEIDCLFEGIDFSSTITRALFETLNMDLFVECIYVVAICLKHAKMDRNNIDEIVLVGGSSRIPMVQQLLQAFFCGKELCKSINPDEAVAYGAAAQAAILSGTDQPNILIVDVTPYSFGLKSHHDPEYMSVVIPRNTPIPARKQTLISCKKDNRSTSISRVFEGNGMKLKDNTLLGVCELPRVPPPPIFIPTIYICFEIDADGILKCSYQDTEIPFSNHSGRLSEKEIDKMKKVVAMFKHEDGQQTQRDKARTELENYCKAMSNMLKDHGEQIGLEDRQKMGDYIEEINGWIDWNYPFPSAWKFEEKMREMKSILGPIVARM